MSFRSTYAHRFRDEAVFWLFSVNVVGVSVWLDWRSSWVWALQCLIAVNTRIAAFTSLLATLSFALSGFSQTCEKVFHFETTRSSRPVTQFTKDLVNSFKSIKGLETTYAAEENPGWKQYQALATLISQLESRGRGKETPVLSVQEVEYLKTELQAWALPSHQLAKELSERPLTAIELMYIDKNYAFFKLQQRVNELVGLNVFPDYYIKQVRSEPELVEQAIKTVDQVKKAQAKLFSTTGHANPAELRRALKQKSKEYADVLNLVDNDLVVAIHRPESGRFWIPLAGFQNQRVTGTSRGSFNQMHRNLVESQLTFQNTAEYSNQSVRYMPNYGEARPKAGSDLLNPNTGADQYGSDLWIVKKSIYESRATWTPRDSFSQPRADSFKSANVWDQMFIPWSSRELMVPYAMAPNYGDKSFTPGTIRDGFPLKGFTWGNNYFEVQIWGPLTLNDIEAFHFKKTPPSKELYDLLTSKSIKVYDERTLPAKIYKIGAK